VENKLALSIVAPSPKVVRWAKILSKFVTVQVAVQLMGVASGILLVRTLSQKEYAYFIIANSLQATMAILADSGISIGLSSIGGRVWQDHFRFGQLINTALRLRRYLAAAAVVITTPIFVWMLASNGASSAYTAILVALVLAGFNYQLLTGVLMVVLRLGSQIDRVQKLDGLLAVTRLALLCGAYFIFLDAAVAVLASVISVIVQYLFLRRWVSDGITVDAPASHEDRAAMLRIVKSQIPNGVFYCLQGQLTIWLISFFGNTENVAEIGALGRLGMIFSVITAVMATIVLPSFARCQSPTQLRRRYFQIVGSFVLFGLSLVALAIFFPGELLWILGGKYGHLRSELALMMTLSASSSVIAAMWSLNSTKAWIKHSWLNIPATVATQILLLFALDISKLDGVILFGIFSLIPNFLLNSMLTYRGLSKEKVLTVTA
jgi:O-antigen/teichoic acid export membrane protein